jgi:hypothetical protein
VRAGFGAVDPAVGLALLSSLLSWPSPQLAHLTACPFHWANLERASAGHSSSFFADAFGLPAPGGVAAVARALPCAASVAPGAAALRASRSIESELADAVKGVLGRDLARDEPFMEVCSASSHQHHAAVLVFVQPAG